MGNLFGTDGIRGIAGSPPLDCTTIYRVGFCLTRYLASKFDCPHILISRDTRISGLWIQRLLERAILDGRGVPETCGVLSTPAVSFLTTGAGAHAGVMISASHNPYLDNGIKVFASTGMKFMDEVENELESEIFSSTAAVPADFAGGHRPPYKKSGARCAPYTAGETPALQICSKCLPSPPGAPPDKPLHFFFGLI
jgi:phosphoglucosamine mutase